MTLHYENSRLAAFLYTLIEETADEVAKWTKHTVVSELPAEIQSKYDIYKTPSFWYDCERNNTAFYLVADNGTSIGYPEFSLFAVEQAKNVTLIRSEGMYPGSIEPIRVLASEVEATAELDRNEAVNAFLDKYDTDSLIPLGKKLK